MQIIADYTSAIILSVWLPAMDVLYLSGSLFLLLLMVLTKTSPKHPFTLFPPPFPTITHGLEFSAPATLALSYLTVFGFMLATRIL